MVYDGVIAHIAGAGRMSLNERGATPNASGDPRRSLASRYTSREQYLTRSREHAHALVEGGYLLAADVPQVIERMEQLWDRAKKEEMKEETRRDR